MKERDVSKFLDQVGLGGVSEKSSLLDRRTRVDTTRAVGSDRMKSAAQMGASRADRLCLLRGGARRIDDRIETVRGDGEDPDDGDEKTVSGRCIGCPGTDKAAGRWHWRAKWQSGSGGDQDHSRKGAIACRDRLVQSGRHAGGYDCSCKGGGLGPMAEAREEGRGETLRCRHEAGATALLLTTVPGCVEFTFIHSVSYMSAKHDAMVRQRTTQRATGGVERGPAPGRGWRARPALTRI